MQVALGQAIMRNLFALRGLLEHQLLGHAGIDNSKMAYERYKQLHSGARWEALAKAGARTQRCLWASTSTKNPSYPDTLYVDELIGPDTVNTMPIETIRAFQDHGTVRETLTEGMDEARHVFEQIEAVGVSYDDVVEVLEREGVEKFADSFDSLMQGIVAKRNAIGAAA